MTADERIIYSRTLWAEFMRRQPPERQRLMSCLEWSLICDWMDRDIPLRVVLRAIDDTGKRANTLVYYEKPVEAAAQFWERAIGG